MLPVITIRRPLDGANGRNWPGVVVIDPAAEMRAAVWAQEVFESIWKLNPWNLLRRTFTARGREEMEVRGHEVEVQAARELYGVDAIEYRSLEAWALSHYKGLWRSIPVQDRHRHVTWMMEAVSDKAKAWVQANLDQIRRHA
jgi:hypothetical protein